VTETVVFALVLALLRGYKLKDIFELLKHWSFYPIIFTCIVHIYMIYLTIHSEYWFIEYAKYIKILSILFYLCLIWQYKLFDMSIFSKFKIKKNPILTTISSPVSLGVLCIWIGSILNIIAMKYNNLKMPVFSNVSFGTGYSKVDMFNEMLQYKDFHTFGDHTTNLIFLTDIFDCFFSIMSIGDIFSRNFVVLVIYYSIKTIHNSNIIIDNKLI